jgi:hypothetical protein
VIVKKPVILVPMLFVLLGQVPAFGRAMKTSKQPGHDFRLCDCAVDRLLDHLFPSA